MYKPRGYTDLAPYLVLKDAEAALGFIHAVFGAEPLRLHRREDDSIAHAEVRIGDTVLMLGEAPGARATNLHLYLPDPEAAMARAEAAGGKVIAPLEDKPDGDMRGGVEAPCGTIWWLARAPAG